MSLKNVIILVSGLIFLLFLFQNTQMVTLRFLFWEITLSQALFMPVVVLVGVVVGYMVARLKG